ncbi:hypothetical protein CCMSSC00406_0005245 [Pleurotus cornucopiae]|uniref:Uncharacterized protein n=1 Tax=Pleurotus cornucopiae TaxID=5321 RepID=A0ACB7IJL0_PLECO|nr:hypothetical protein CCMSSC00406_0005245 [Pleurotus cornucopiae]
MAALYLHNAIFVPEPSEDSMHSHHRTASSGTLRTTTSDSHPTEPLLRNTASESSLTYRDLLSHQPSHPNMQGFPGAGDTRLDLFSDTLGVEERKGYTELAVRRRLRRLRLVKRLLELIIAIWTAYNIVRYFIAYTVYTSFRGQIAAVSLGTITSVSLAIFLTSEVLAVLKAYLMFHDVPLQFQFILRTVLHAISHFLLLVPTIVNIALVVAWRNLKRPDIAFLERCNMDIDVVWSVSSVKCSAWTWQTWLSFAIVRIMLTIALIVLHFYTAFAYQRTRRPGHLPRRPFILRHGHGRGQSATELLPNAPPPSAAPHSASFADNHTHQPSYTTLASSARHARSSNSLRRQSSSQTRLTRAPRPSPTSSSSDLSSTELDVHNNNPLKADSGMDGFLDRYSAAISQIHRETEEGMLYAQPDTPRLPPGAAPPRPPENYIHTMAAYDEYGRPRPPEGHVRVMGALVKRMPTIESIGSGEAASVLSARGGMRTPSPHNSGSRPPTRANTFSTMGSEPPSRANSLSVAVERSNIDIDILYPVDPRDDEAEKLERGAIHMYREWLICTSDTGGASLDRATSTAAQCPFETLHLR